MNQEIVDGLISLRQFAQDEKTRSALEWAIDMAEDRRRHWEEQARIAREGGHGPGSDF